MSNDRALRQTATGPEGGPLGPEDLGIGVLFALVPEALLVVEAQTSRVTMLNPAAERLFGLTTSEALGLPLERFLPDQPLSWLATEREGVALGHQGQPIAVEVRVVPLETALGSHHVLLLRDIQARKALEAESQQRALQLAEAEHLAQIGSWLWDLSSKQVRWSDELYRIVGLQPECYTPTFESYLEVVHESYREHVQTVVFRALEDREPFAYYARLVRPDGKLRTIHCRGSVVVGPDGRPLRMIGTVQDVTEPLRLEAALKESEAKLRAIVDQATDGIWLKDLAGRFVLINPAGAAITGHTVAEVLGKRDRDVHDPETARRIEAIDERILATGERETYEITIGDPSEQPRTFFSIKYPFVREDGTIQGLVVITRDITERKRLQETLQEQYERLKELDALKTDFVNAVSHELRTPLTSIRGYVEFMEDGIGGPLTPQHAEFVQEIDRATQRLTRLVDDLLDFARIQAGTFELRTERFDLADKLRRMAMSLVPQAEKGHVRLEVTATPPLIIEGDRQRLGQVILNLANNAIKFTPPGGQVEVRGAATAEGIRCEVRDTGPGIAPEDVGRLFQKFTQLSAGRHKGGSGLGLSICKAIIEAHGGTIGVESTPGAGSVFWFTLPAAQDA